MNTAGQNFQRALRAMELTQQMGAQLRREFRKDPARYGTDPTRAQRRTESLYKRIEREQQAAGEE